MKQRDKKKNFSQDMRAVAGVGFTNFRPFNSSRIASIRLGAAAGSEEYVLQ